MKLNDNLAVIKDLGSGAFGQVFLCNYQKDGFSKLVAVKKVNNQDNKEKVFKEALINSELSHPNIVQIYNIEYDSNNNILFIYEYVEGISLREHLESTTKLSLGEAIFIFNCLLRGIELAHSKGIIHHDISPRNIILSIHGEVKILDFGLAKIQGSYQNDVSEISGSISYYDPYLIQNKKSYDKEADIYSAVLIFYEMLTGRRFFPSGSPVETIEFLKEFACVDEIDLEDIENESLQKILRLGLDVKRESRLLISEIKDILKDFKIDHPVISKGLSHKEGIVEKTLSLVKTSQKSKSKRVKISILGIFISLVIVLLGLVYFQDDKIYFYVKNESELFSATLGDLDKNTTSYNDLNQIFSKKSCDYYFASFITSIVLLNNDQLAQKTNVKSSLESRLKMINRFYSSQTYMNQRCPRIEHQKLSKLIYSFEEDYKKIIKEKKSFEIKGSSLFQNISKEFEKNDELIIAFEEASSWLKKYYYNIKSITRNDIFRATKDKINLEDCALFSEYIIVDSLISFGKNLKDLDHERIIGVESLTNLTITGLYKDKLIFSANSTNNFLNELYCIYDFKNGKSRVFAGKLHFSKIK